MARAQSLSSRARRLTVAQPFELELALFGHGWVDLAPNRYDKRRRCLTTVIDLGRVAVDVTLTAERRGLALVIDSKRPLARGADASVGRAVRHMLRLGEDFSAFYQLAKQRAGFEWVARRGGGRLLRAPTLFEDLAKLLLTTNCTWAQTRSMVARLCEALGKAGPSGVKAFPRARAIASVSADFLRQQGRLGYRAEALLELGRRFQNPRSARALECLAGDALRAELLSFKGFGPYAVGQALRLLGNYEDYALDSWCRNKFLERGQACSPHALSRRYAAFKEYRGLALWLDLTAPWHGEGPHAAEGVAPLRE